MPISSRSGEVSAKCGARGRSAPANEALFSRQRIFTSGSTKIYLQHGEFVLGGGSDASVIYQEVEVCAKHNGLYLGLVGGGLTQTNRTSPGAVGQKRREKSKRRERRSPRQKQTERRQKFDFALLKSGPRHPWRVRKIVQRPRRSIFPTAKKSCGNCGGDKIFPFAALRFGPGRTIRVRSARSQSFVGVELKSRWLGDGVSLARR